MDIYGEQPEHQYYYCVDDDWLDDCLDIKSYVAPTDEGYRIDIVASACGEDYHHNHGGWEASYPMDIYLYDANKKLIGKYSVDRQPEPVFNACKVNYEPKEDE